MKILVTGGNGQLGSALRLAAVNSSHDYIFTDIEDLDITSAEQIENLFLQEHIDIIINCAAYTAVDMAESDEPMADTINHKAASLLAEACAKHDATLIHISTDYIFSGKASTPYLEDSEPSPLNAYGRTKLAGERAIASSGCRSIIIRTAWLYSEFGRNFVKTMHHLTTTRPEIKVVADQFGSPTYAGDLAKAIVHIIESGQTDKLGIYHYTNEGVCSWYDFANEIARQSGNFACKINPCTTEEYSTAATRPRYSVLNKHKIVETFGIAIPEWQDSLRICIDKL